MKKLKKALQVDYCTVFGGTISRYIEDNDIIGLRNWLIGFFRNPDKDFEDKKKALIDSEKLLFLGYIREKHIDKIVKVINAFLEIGDDSLQILECKSLIAAIKDKESAIKEILQNDDHNKQILLDLWTNNFAGFNLKDDSYRAQYEEVENLLLGKIEILEE